VFSDQLVPTLHSSSYLEGNSKTWILDDTTHAFKGMDDTHQRVLLLLSYAVVEPKLVDEGYALKFEKACRTALKPLVDARQIKIDSVDVIFGPNGNIYKRLTFTRLTDGVQVVANGIT